MDETQAKVVALRALAYLAGDPEALQRFCDLSGVDGADLRRRANEPAMLAGVLDFFLGNEAQLLEMCQAMELPGEAPALARRGLPGGRNDEWS